MTNNEINNGIIAASSFVAVVTTSSLAMQATGIGMLIHPLLAIPLTIAALGFLAMGLIIRCTNGGSEWITVETARGTAYVSAVLGFGIGVCLTGGLAYLL